MDADDIQTDTFDRFMPLTDVFQRQCDLGEREEQQVRALEPVRRRQVLLLRQFPAWLW